MGTRGFITFVADGVEKTSYNQFDSYPSGLGAEMLTWLRAALDARDVLQERVAALWVVDEDSKPTLEEIERLRKFADQRVSTGRLDDWYVLLRETQGNPHLILEAGVIEDASGFPADSLYAEYGYVVDLDTETFEVYEGFQKRPHKKGRFADRERMEYSVGNYYPVALAQSWKFTDLPTDEEFLAALEDMDEAAV